ncbi:permease [Chloroflexota bacterium]
MDLALIVLVALVIATMIIAFWKGRWQLLFSGLKQTKNTFKSMWFRILLGLAFGGLIQVLIPGPLIAEWLGPTSGMKGILIGSYAGVIMSGGPYVILPVIASIYAAGAGVGPVIALLTGGVLGIQGLITYQIPFLGIKLAMARYIVCLIIPPIVGLLGAVVYELL